MYIFVPCILLRLSENSSDLLDRDSPIDVLDEVWVQEYVGLRLRITQAIMSPVQIAPTVYKLPNGAQLLRI